jgi:hydrogenase nickel incorporation protein HypA/HybF
MHELSIAQEILGIVNQHVLDPKPNTVKSVRVKVGKLSNILTDSLTFCFDAITSDTPLSGVRLEVIEIPVKINCTSCNRESEIEPPVFACPICGNNQIRIVSGTELQVDEIELFDEITSISEFRNQDREEK